MNSTRINVLIQRTESKDAGGQEVWLEVGRESRSRQAEHTITVGSADARSITTTRMSKNRGVFTGEVAANLTSYGALKPDFFAGIRRWQTSGEASVVECREECFGRQIGRRRRGRKEGLLEEGEREQEADEEDEVA